MTQIYNNRNETQVDPNPTTFSIGSSYEGKPVVDNKSGTVFSGFTVLTKSMIGAGMFSMAIACHHFGLILGIASLMLAGLITWLSLKALSRLCMDYMDTNPTFYSISAELTPRFKWVVDVALILNCWGGCIAYVLTFGKLLAQGVVSIFKWDELAFPRENTMLCIQAAILLGLAPMCMMKDISSTKVANVVGIVCILYLFIMTFVYTPCTLANVDMLRPGNLLKAFGSFPTFVFAYGCQQNMISVATEMKNPTMKRFDVVSITSTIAGFIIYLPVMVLPFLTFGDKIQGSYLFNFADSHGDKIPVIIGFVLASISVSVSYVLLMQPVRRSTMSLIFGANQPVGVKERSWRCGIVAAYMAGSYVLAYLLRKNIGLPINIAGLIGGNTMCFVMPFVFYLAKYGYSMKNKFSICVVATLVFCVLLYPLCLTGIIYTEVTK